MIRNFALPLLSICGIALALQTVSQGEKPTPAAAPAAEPARSPFDTTIAGAGIVESASENLALGTAVPGIVVSVSVAEGDFVRAGAELFSIDARDLAGERGVRQAAVASAAAELARLEALPRPEDLPPARARLEAAEATARDAAAQLERAMGIDDPRAMSEEERTRRAMNERFANARLAEARGELAKLEAGVWAPEREIARAALDRARAALDQLDIEQERRVVRAPRDGVVLQLNARLGEYAPSGVLRDPLVLFGDVSRLHVRVDIDESEAWRVRVGAKARATIRGNHPLSTPLEFVRIEPYVLPKRSLTGDTSERVDTRVLQVIYAFDPAALSAYVGQQMDVFIEGPEEAK